MAKFSTYMLTACLSAAALAVPAAASEDQLPRVEVRYVDLDLSQAGDRERLTDRIERATRQVCRAGSGRDLKQQAQSKACRAQAMQSVEVQLASVLGGYRTALAEREGRLISAR